MYVRPYPLVRVALVLDDKPSAWRPTWDKPQIMISHDDAAEGVWPPMVSLREAASLAEVFRCLGHEELADAIGAAAAMSGAA